MRKVFMLLMAASAILFTGCSKSNTDSSDPTKEVGPINKQWSYNVDLGRWVEWTTYDFTTPGTFILASRRDEGDWTVALDTVMDSLKYSNDAKTAGTIYYKNKLGNPTKLEFKDAGENDVKFLVGGSTYQTYTKSNFVLK